MKTALCASVAAAAAVWLRRPDDWLVVRHRLGPPASASEPWRPPRSMVAVAATCVVVVAVPSTTTQIALVAIVGAALFALKQRGVAQLRRQAAVFRAEVAQVLRSTTADLRAGVEPAAALRAATGGTTLHAGRAGGTDAFAAWQTVHAAGRSDVQTALQAAATTPGGESLADVSAAWHLAEQAGAPLAVILDRMAGSLQGEVELDREVAAEAEPARATARLMAALPLFGLGLGLLLGVNPVAVLVGSGLGVACLVAGLVLACCGVWWIDRIVSALDEV